MTRRKIPRKYIDLFHILLFAIILFLFAHYEAKMQKDKAFASLPQTTKISQK